MNNDKQIFRLNVQYTLESTYIYAVMWIRIYCIWILKKLKGPDPGQLNYKIDLKKSSKSKKKTFDYLV